MTLLVLQREMRAWLRGDDTAACYFGPVARAGLDVYQNNYRAQLVACLADKFERTMAWLGDDAFRSAAVRHIDNTPPHDWTLDRYGSDFPQTLQALYPNDPEVSELAWLDHALADAFVGPDRTPVSPQSLATMDWDRAVLQFTPTLRVGHALTNSTAIWSALSANKTPPPVEALPQPAVVLVWRKELTSCFRTLEATEVAAIAHIRSGGTFSALCSMLVEIEGDAASVRIAGEILAQWLRDELVVGIEL
ncbi:MAG: DNA-binding domain-containing protein [Steroidobacteraceae bacterium]